MKTHLFYRSIFCILLAFLIQSCNESVLKPEVELNEGFVIQIGSRRLYTLNDIAYYDGSSHYFHFKNGLPGSLQELGGSKFWILSEGEIIYEGTFVSLTCCSWENDSTIVFQGYNLPNYVLKLGHLFCGDWSDTLRKDYRENETFLNELRNLNILHEGMECTVDSIFITGTKEVTLHYRITNKDEWDYWFPDPEKVEPFNGYNLNQYISFYDFANKKYLYKINPSGQYFGYGKQDTCLLSLIKAGESGRYTRSIALSDTIKKGTYWLRFTIPGLGGGFEKPDEGIMKGERIWMGELERFIKIEL